jgi:predicted  nucleic acid-binding Zn-ribbon protein
MDYIKNWIIDSYNNTKLSCKSCLFITGNSGIGKTHLVNTICAELDLFIVNINSFNCGSSKQLDDFQNEEWSKVGEHLKNNGIKNLPPEWSVYVDFEKSVSQNMQRCFEKSKAAKAKISGSQHRLAALNQEVEDLSDLTESKFEKFQQNLVNLLP